MKIISILNDRVFLYSESYSDITVFKKCGIDFIVLYNEMGVVYIVSYLLLFCK